MASPHRPQPAGRAVADSARRLVAGVDGWDLLLAVSAVMLFAGLALTWDAGIALLVCGVLGLAAGVAGARGAELAGAVARKGGG